MTSRLALSVPILEDELLSSWLVRTAFAQGCDPLVLTGYIWPGWRAWGVDVDRGITAERIAKLATASGLDPGALAATTMKFLLELAPSSKCGRPGIWPWLLSLGSRNRRRRGGNQYCPRCFAADRTPYFRRAWRIAWHTVCDIHGEMLRDICQACGACLEPHRLEASHGRLDRCATCLINLADVPGATPLPGALAFQRLAGEVHRFGFGVFGERTLPARDWFMLAHYFTSLMRRVRAVRPQRMAAFFKALGVDAEESISNLLRPSLALEMLSVRSRAHILCWLPELFSVGAAGIVEAAEAASLTQATFDGTRAAVPAMLQVSLLRLPEGHRAPRHLPRGPAKGPLSPGAVMRRCVLMGRRMAKQ